MISYARPGEVHEIVPLVNTMTDEQVQEQIELMSDEIESQRVLSDDDGDRAPYERVSQQYGPAITFLAQTLALRCHEEAKAVAAA